jgi:hypothetical protein
MFSIAVNMLRPKKNANPQSNEPGNGAPKVLKAVLLPLNTVVASSIAKLTVP